MSEQRSLPLQHQFHDCCRLGQSRPKLDWRCEENRASLGHQSLERLACTCRSWWIRGRMGNHCNPFHGGVFKARGMRRCDTGFLNAGLYVSPRAPGTGMCSHGSSPADGPHASDRCTYTPRFPLHRYQTQPHPEASTIMSFRNINKEKVSRFTRHRVGGT
jgi:hypothetical protein